MSAFMQAATSASVLLWDGGNGQLDGLADPHAGGVDQRETGAVDRRVDGGDQAAAVLVVSDVGKALTIGLADVYWSRGASRGPGR